MPCSYGLYKNKGKSETFSFALFIDQNIDSQKTGAPPCPQAIPMLRTSR